MNVNGVSARKLVREANPFPADSLVGSVAQPSAQQLLHRITAGEAVPVSATDLVPLVAATRAGVAGAECARRRLVPLLAAVVIIVLAGSAVGLRAAVHRSSRPGTVAAPSSTTPRAYTEQLLNRVPLPAGAQRSATAPLKSLAGPAARNGAAAAAVAWWTVPEAYQAVVHRVSTMALPPNWKLAEDSSFNGIAAHGFVFEIRDPQTAFVATAGIGIAAQGPLVAIRADVNVYLRAVRTAGQIIPESVDTASVNLHGVRSYRRTLRGIAVTRLARQVNAAPTFVQLTSHSCPLSAVGGTITFASGSRRHILEIRLGGCGSASLAQGSGDAVRLANAGALGADVLAAAGLPANWFDQH